jgi:hypothetical protein
MARLMFVERGIVNENTPGRRRLKLTILSEDRYDHILDDAEALCAIARSNRCLSSAFGATPTRRSTSFPDLNTSKVGILRTLKRPAVI